MNDLMWAAKYFCSELFILKMNVQKIYFSDLRINMTSKVVSTSNNFVQIKLRQNTLFFLIIKCKGIKDQQIVE